MRAINRYVLAVLEKVAERRAHVRIGIGPESYEMFRADYLMAPVSPLSVTGNRVPTTSPSIVFVGTWGGRKRGSMVAAAAERARRDFHPDTQLTVFGPESDRSKWPSWVNHISGADDAAVQAGIRDSWLLAAPSAYEGFGIPAFEAMALGVPVVATSNPGSDFLAELVGMPAAFQILSDSHYEAGLMDRLKVGPDLSAGERDAVTRAVDDLLAGATADFLVSEIYEPAVAKLRARR